MSAIPIIGSVLGGLFSSSASKRAARTQADAAKEAAELQLEATRETNDMYREFRADDIQRFDPFYRGGLDAYNALNYEILGGDVPMSGGTAYRGFTATPGYEFRRNEGRNAVESGVAARQGANSGAAMKALERYGQNFAANEYQNYLGRLSGLAQGGMDAAGRLSNSSLNYGTQIGGSTMAGANAAATGITNAGNAAAAGTIGSANAWNNALTQGIGAWQYNNMLNKFAK